MLPNKKEVKKHLHTEQLQGPKSLRKQPVAGLKSHPWACTLTPRRELCPLGVKLAPRVGDPLLVLPFF
jgi:hypothetical protein